jgi:small subunit ribosomal protein S6
MSDTLSKFREYETVLVIPAELPDEAAKQVLERLTTVVNKHGGSVLREDGWGKKKFAYDVRKHSRGNYLVFHYAAPAETVFQVERTLRNLDAVIRFVTHRFGEVTDLEARRADIEKMMRERAKREQEAKEAAERAETEGTDGSQAEAS